MYQNRKRWKQVAFQHKPQQRISALACGGVAKNTLKAAHFRAFYQQSSCLRVHTPLHHQLLPYP